MFRSTVLAAALLAAPAAQGATVTYSSLAAYDAFLGAPSTVVENFTGNRLNGSTISQVLGAQSFANNRLQNVAGGMNGTQSTSLVFSTAMTSFAMRIANLGLTEVASVLLDGVQVATITGGSTFFALSSTIQFTTITFVDITRPLVNTQFAIDDIRATPVPLPAGAALLAGGLGALGFARRRRAAA